MSGRFRYEEEKQTNGMEYYDKVSTSKWWAHYKVVGRPRIVGGGGRVEMEFYLHFW